MIRISIEELKEEVTSGKKFNLMDNLLVQGKVLISKDRVLTIKDIERIENQGKRSIKVEEVGTVEVDRSDKEVILNGMIKVFNEHPHYKMIQEEKKDVYREYISNTIFHSPYVISKFKEILVKNKRLALHSIHVAIKSLILDQAYQNKYNQGMFDGLELENVFCGALLHDIGYLVKGLDLLNQKRVEIPANHADYMQHPNYGYELIKADQEKMGIHPQLLNVIRQHHEYANGKGFPNGVRGSNLHYTSQIVGMANEIDLAISGELTTEKRNPEEILRKFAHSDSFDKNITSIMIHEFSFIYHLK